LVTAGHTLAIKAAEACSLTDRPNSAIRRRTQASATVGTLASHQSTGSAGALVTESSGDRSNVM
jgi:hypothetical protein